MSKENVQEIFSIAEFPDPIPQARHFRVYYCPSCPNAHIVLFDEDDCPFAQFVVGPPNLDRLSIDCDRVYNKDLPNVQIIKFPFS